MTLGLTLPPATAGAPDAVVLGENSLDFVAVQGDRPAIAGKKRLASFDMLAGGQGATAAVGCARQGCRTRYIGTLGDDEWGRAVRLSLEGAGVEVLARQAPGARSRIAVILVDPDGERTVLEYRDPALSSAGPVAPADAASGRVLLVDATDLPASIAAARAARSAGVPTVVDVDRVEPGVDDLLGMIDLLVAPADFVTAFAGVDEVGRALEQLRAAFRPALAVATLGPAGSLATIGGREIRTPGFAVAVADTTGAGDAFRAGLVSALILFGAGVPVEELLTWANATAALNCRAVGAQTSLPTRDEVEALVTAAPARRSK